MTTQAPITPKEKLRLSPGVESIITLRNPNMAGVTHYGVNQQGKVLCAVHEFEDGETEHPHNHLEIRAWWEYDRMCGSSQV